MGLFNSALKAKTQKVPNRDGAGQRKKKKISPLRKQKEYKGLCLICKNAHTCTFRRDATKPVSSCEEFEIELKTKKILSVKGASMSMNDAVDEGIPDEEKRKYRGLCMNCVHRKTCSYRKPESGVWFCEEYE